MDGIDFSRDPVHEHTECEKRHNMSPGTCACICTSISSVFVAMLFGGYLYMVFSSDVFNDDADPISASNMSSSDTAPIHELARSILRS